MSDPNDLVMEKYQQVQKELMEQIEAKRIEMGWERIGYYVPDPETVIVDGAVTLKFSAMVFQIQ